MMIFSGYGIWAGPGVREVIQKIHEAFVSFKYTRIAIYLKKFFV